MEEIFEVLHPDIQNFINDHLTTSVSELAFKKNPFPTVPYALILQQIESKQKSKEKLPSWFSTPNIVYPKKLSIEQTSSEDAAFYKSTLISGNHLIDLTGGFGIDTFYFSKKMTRVTHCEIQETLSSIVAHNMNSLEVSNVDYFNGDSLNYLIDKNEAFEWIFLDPARRNDVKGKVFLLQDCTPNILDHLDTYFQFTSNILLKTSPLLDIQSVLQTLPNIKEIHTVTVNHEVKELLWILEKNFKGTVRMIAGHIHRGKITQTILNTSSELPLYSTPKKYLYEPHAGIMKLGQFDTIASQFNVYKLHPNSHLYTSDYEIEFPGRCFKVEMSLPFSKTNIKEHLYQQQAHITTRNFPEKVDEFRRKWKIKDGGDLYVFLTTQLPNNKIILFCKKNQP